MNEKRVGKDDLERSYAAVVSLMKDRAASFYSAFSGLPRARFLGTAALYGFCRYADDTVDHAADGEPLETVRSKLDDLEKEVWGLYRSGPAFVPQSDEIRQSIWWPAFSDTVHQFSIQPDSFLAQIRGQRLDADFPGIKDEAELIEYGRLVAGSVGTMMLPLLANDPAGSEDRAFSKACEHLGIGMQITNILRDVGEDLRSRSRLYLPLDLMDRFGVTREQLENLAETSISCEVPVPEGFIRLWEHLADLADTFYDDYLNWLAWFHPDCRIPLAAAALIYRAIADAVRKEGYNCFTRRCYTDESARTKLLEEAATLVLSKNRTPGHLQPEDAF